MSTTQSTHVGAHAPAHRSATPALSAAPAPSTSIAGEDFGPALALLQQHQVSQISLQTISAAEDRLQDALDEARQGRRVDPALLLQQLATDLGITLSLS